MSSLPITSIIAGFLAIMMVPLTLQISIRRATLGYRENSLTAYVFGDGGDDILRRRIRAFGNFIEYVPTCLILLALVEGAGTSSAVVWVLGGSLLVNRIFHAIGMLYFDHPAIRGIAMFMTYGVILFSGISLLSHYLF